MGDVVAPDLEELRAFTARLRCVGPCGEAGVGIEWLAAVESLKSVGCAVQAVVTDDVATCMREDRKVRGLPRAEWDRGIALAVNLVVSDETLLAGESEAADLAGFGPAPAGIARQLVADALEGETETTLRLIYACPLSGSLTAMESQSRTFPKSLRKLIDLRDRTCRTPWCDAPIRHHDHILSRRKKGATTAHNGAGLCAACNYAKEGDGWTARPVRRHGRTHLFDLGTPTGHHYRSVAPRLPSAARRSEIEAILTAHLRAS
ncbi:HNH endonuclease signature motif containing protein [Rhodococcus sp. T2V]|uniref:HNH endonuclease n=1 Tax=Rhodococcus sp. T2V TaxID=3034164 RepID=UPI0023E25461|nr:HNH endonuclease signature motif containing protein [Rhodococcus sp. T2V]MDF3310445.1 HNH endonuclease signature motif containing protein [Rhodococcus sp. T2V]